MDICPQCGGPLQQVQKLDSDDSVLSAALVCKAKVPNKKKKGCGYRRQVKV